MAEITALILNFLKALGKYRWHAVSIAWLVALIGWAMVWRMPNTYETSARVYVDTQSILKPLLSGMTTLPNLDQQVSFMRQTLISRPNVEKVMRDTDLDVKATTTREKEQIIEGLMRNIKVSGTGRDDIYSISYTSTDAKLGKDVVQSLLTIFVEGSFGGKKQDSDKAIQFINDQIRSTEEKLAADENKLKEFKIRNMGLMPQNGDFSGRVAGANEALNQARLELAEAEQSRNAIRRRMSGSGKEGGGMVDPELEGRLAAAQKSLDTLRLQYTEEHPDIIATRRLIEQLQARKKEEAKKDRPDPGTATSLMMQQMMVSLSDAESRVAGLRARVNEYANRVTTLRAQSTTAPEVEAQLSQLTRDYQINRDNYEKLVQRREQAKLSGDLSSATDMLTFRVVEPPMAATKPSGPNRPMLFSGVFLMALAAGVVGAFLLSQVRPTFLSHAALRQETGFPVLGSISMHWTDSQKVLSKRRLLAVGASVLVLFSAYAVGMATMLVRANA
ncbi:XrtA system polysaccharide chain length determinant [Massilia sp. CFBP 13721]|uniref:XrtA system polysaccharide chain length determinant n=2 Tax=unclassified Massilia TaxID=2609279 RepID=UPI00177D9B91|nr:XrtA system polysaccharide chain length determinant [Massilia sp. CFBP 13721]MBD8674426.1 chain length-determining protein [Massilia sp. CFBP 13721]